ncbi:MAG TPA: hypothetical protein VIM11_05990 [Tepidisphaeraceae bacterium]|jgi:hypothetical protein
MWRRIFTLACVVSFLFCIGVGGLWVRSTRVHDYVGWARAGGRYVQIRASNGIACIDVVSVCQSDQVLTWRSAPVGGPVEFATYFNGQARSFRQRRIAGISLISAITEFVPPRDATPLDVIWDANWREVSVSYSHLLALGSVLPLCRVAAAVGGRVRRRYRARRQRCPKCGYDLRMTPDRCPECGCVPENATGTK